MKRRFTKTISWLLMTVLLLLSASACSKDLGTNSQRNDQNSLNEEYSSTTENTTEKKLNI